MSSIDQVIARSRQPGAFAERKRFTVARQRALQKMRKFALAHPAYYIVELIQAAIANGATYLDIDVESSAVALSYVGGSFDEEQLGQLFDFLFASKELLELADVRQLALGVNALLLAEPREVVIESGDGTLTGTTRVQIDGKKNTVEVGTPTQPLRGTYIRATGFKRSVLGYGMVGPKELDVIESRCLTAPVPIIVNTNPIFGYTSQRTPRLFGCQASISFDEGDLYGTIGLSKFEGESREIKLLTWGVWIESVQKELLPDLPLGGVVVFDRLHKTADHSSIVRDDRYQEMWVRVLPYAKQLRSGRTGAATFDISLADGTLLSATHLRKIFTEFGGAVVVPRFAGPGTGARYHAAQGISEALRLPMLIRGEEPLGTLRLLAGSGARIVEPNVDDEAEVEFYRRPAAEPPPRPWLIGSVELEPVSAEAFVNVVERHALWGITSENREELLARLGRESTLRATIFTPEEVPRGDADLWVEVRSTERVVWAGNVQCPYPGHVLVIETPDLSPRLLLDAPGGIALIEGEPLAALIAEGMSRLAFEPLRTATSRVLSSLARFHVEPGSAGARIALAALARSAIMRLRADDEGKGRVCFSLLDPELDVSILDVPIFTTLDEVPRSAHDLETLMEETGGLLYGVLPDVTPDLTALYLPRILKLDAAQERFLIALVGEASYVRVDRRDVLAEHEGLRCRDVALGVRSFAHFPLLVEGEEDPSSWDEARQRTCEEALVKGLVELLKLRRTDPELSRQALRHLLFYISFKYTLGQQETLLPLVSNLPLFRDVDGFPRTFNDLSAQLQSAEGLAMHDGWSVDTAGSLGGDDQGSPSVAPSFRGLAMNPFVFSALSPVGKVVPALDFDLSEAEAQSMPWGAYLSEVRIDEDFVEGSVGIPTVAVDRPVVHVFDPSCQQVVVISGPARALGIVGRINMKRLIMDGDKLALEQILRRAAVAAYDELISRLSEINTMSPDYERHVSVVLDLAARSVQMTASPRGGGSAFRISVEILQPDAKRVLDLPLFPTTAGVVVSAYALITEWANSHRPGEENAIWERLSPSAPPPLKGWLEKMLTDERIVFPATHGWTKEDIAPLSASSDSELASWLTDTIAQLRTDPMGELHPTRVVFADVAEGQVMKVGETPILTMSTGQLHQFCHIGGEPYLVLNGCHWLVERARAGGGDSEASAWLLLACYGHINDVLEPVTNEHELAFHERIAELIEGGTLSPLHNA